MGITENNIIVKFIVVSLVAIISIVIIYVFMDNFVKVLLCDIFAQLETSEISRITLLIKILVGGSWACAWALHSLYSHNIDYMLMIKGEKEKRVLRDIINADLGEEKKC